MSSTPSPIGGSFTALAYGLYGDKLFDDYEQRFLKRDVQGELIARAMNPGNWGSLGSTGWGRSELAAQLYDEILFNGATFGDLQRGKGPLILASATDISTGSRLVFNQSTFDILCSDLSAVRLSRAHQLLEANGEGPFALAFAVTDAEAFRAHAEACGLRPGPAELGTGRNASSGAVRSWRGVMLDAAPTFGPQLFAIEHLSPPELLPLAPPTSTNEDATVHAVDHVVVHTKDGDRARALYGDALGIRLALDKSFPEWRARLLFFRCGDLVVEIAHDLTKEVSEAPDELWGLSWRTPDVARCQARLKKAGVEVSAPRDGRRPGTQVFTVESHTANVPTIVIGGLGRW